MTVNIHTDGSCHGNPGPGGWAAVILTPAGGNLTLRDGEPRTTNNRMELTAVIRALKALENMPWTNSEDIVVHTDSKYVCDAFQQNWIWNWQRNGWRTAKKQPVLNQDLWEELIPLAGQHGVAWEWVKGHSGDHWNELCDQIANEEADRQELEVQADGAANEDGDGPEEAPGAYNRGYQAGYQDGFERAKIEFARKLEEFTQAVQELEPRNFQP